MEDEHRLDLMNPPPGYKFIPKGEKVCASPGCFQCFDIYCERCESKDRRIVELEMRNNDLVKYITQLQGRIFGTRGGSGAPGGVTAGAPGGNPISGNGNSGPAGEPFAVFQSPVLYDPNLGVNYVSTTTFAATGGGGMMKR